MKLPGLTSQQSEIVIAMREGADLCFVASTGGVVLVDFGDVDSISEHQISEMLAAGYIEPDSENACAYRLTELGNTAE